VSKAESFNAEHHVFIVILRVIILVLPNNPYKTADTYKPMFA